MAMRFITILCFVFVMLVNAFFVASPAGAECAYKAIRLHGKVQEVISFPGMR